MGNIGRSLEGSLIAMKAVLDGEINAKSSDSGNGKRKLCYTWYLVIRSLSFIRYPVKTVGEEYQFILWKPV